MTVGYYEKIKDYLHPHINQYINHYRSGGIIDLPPYHGCNHLNRCRTRKETEYNLGYQCVIPTYKTYLKKTKNKYKSRYLYWARYMTRTNCRNLFKKKGNFVFNYKLQKYEHLSETPMRYTFYHIQNVKDRWQKHWFK